jgi:hypothetical protein
MIQVYSADEVRNAVAKFFSENDHADGPAVTTGVCRILGQTRHTNSYNDRDNLARLDNQIKRFADAMAVNGELWKIKRGEKMPGGHETNYSHYFTMAGYKTAQERATEAKLAKTEQYKRAAAIRGELESRGFMPRLHIRDEFSISLTLKDWERFLGVGT